MLAAPRPVPRPNPRPAPRPHRPRLFPAVGWVLPLLLLAGLLAPTSAWAAAATTPATDPVGAPQPVVSGARLLDGRTGTPLRVAGVNRSGSEYACAQGWGLFDGPVDDAALAAIASWGTNAVRLPLNESCWLGTNGAPAQLSGPTYRQAITDLVARLHGRGQAVVLDLHWSATGSELAAGQAIAPGPQSAAFWRSVATTFRDDPSVMFELFNEPREISWACWRDGCTTPQGWRSTGMQALVDAVRGTGARQPVIVGGLNWAGDLSGWAAHAPTDPLRSLVAGWHIYDFSQCNTQECWDRTAGVLSRSVPVLLTEVGQTGCATGFIDRILPWADRVGIGYVAWSWNAASCSDGPSLVSAYDGTPTAFGAGYQRHLRERPAAAPDPSGAPAEPTPSSTTVPADAEAVFGFEDGTQGWTPRWGEVSTQAWDRGGATGRGSLAVRVEGAGYPAVGVDVGDRLAARLAGAEVSMRVWVPAGPDGRAPLTVSPVTLDSGWRPRVGAPQQLVPGTWSTVSTVVPQGGTRVLGLQLDVERPWRGTVHVDDVRVGAAVRAGFDTTEDGWGRTWGEVTTTRRTTTTYAGSGALTVRLTQAGYPAVGTSRTSGLEPGMRVSMRVHAPRSGAPAVRPVLLDDSWTPVVLPQQTLRAGWNDVVFTVPRGLTGPRSVGLQVENGQGWRGDLGLDSVAW